MSGSDKKKKTNIIVVNRNDGKNGKLNKSVQKLIKPTVKRSFGDEEKEEAKKRLAALVTELVGDRTIRKAADDAKVTASYISGMMNGQFLPSAEILRKLAAPSANPQNGVTLEDLMIAAGYQQDYIKEAITDRIESAYYEELSKLQADIKRNDAEYNLIRKYYEEIKERMDYMSQERKDREQEETRFEKLALSVIYRSLSEKGISFSKLEDIVGIRGYKPDLVVSVSGQPISEWWFEIKYLTEKKDFENDDSILSFRRIIGQFIFIEPKAERKISLVIADKEVFDRIVGYKDKLSYKGDLTVMLIDESDFSVTQEVYLAHYAEQGTESEVYIV